MPLLTRKPLTAGTTFLQAVKVAGGQAFTAPYSLELKLKSAASLAVNLIPAGAAAPSHTVTAKSKTPGWVTFHFLLGPGANGAATAFGDFAVEIKNLNAGQQVVIEEGQLTFGATMVVPHERFESRLCQETFTTAECLSILRAEVAASRSLVAALPYLMEWESLLVKRFGKGTDKWSDGNRDEFNSLVDAAMDEAQDKIKEEMTKRMEFDLIVESIEETLKKLLPVMVRGMLPWIERLGTYGTICGTIMDLFSPSVIVTNHQMAVLSGEAALHVPIRERFLEQMPAVHKVLSDTIVTPGPSIGPLP